MKQNIGAESARWAGLQIDLNTKYRSGKVTQDQLYWFLNIPEEKREALMVGDADNRFEQVGEFSVVVPEGYDHATRLTKFSDEHRKEFNYWNDAITDENYGKATTKLVAGRKFEVRVFQIKETVTSENCLGFLKSQKAVLVGAQGASLTYEQGKNRLPVNRWSVSFDEKKALWQDADGLHGVPCVRRFSGDDFGFGLGNFEREWSDNCCLLCFCDIEPDHGDSFAEGLSNVIERNPIRSPLLAAK